MAISTYKVFLMQKMTENYEKLIDIKDFPDLGGEPEMLETTTLSDPMQTFIPGIKSNGALSFTANYTKAEYDKIKKLEGQELDLAVFFGGSETNGVVSPTGDDGKFGFKGSVSVYIPGKGVNEVVDMTITVAPSTPITPIT